ncbi:MAG: SAM-dependent methyltransferase [Rikenellaceae bacterium]
MSSLPPKFVERIKVELGEAQSNCLFAALDGEASISVRYNRLKASTPDSFDRVVWSKDGIYLEKRPVFTIDPHFHSGCYYPQEASSMFLEQIVDRFVVEGEENGQNILALDLCAAPGGKSTILATALSEKGFLVANETIKSRAKILQENIIKWGTGNVAVTSNDSEDFRKLGAIFDLIVVDTPCSGEGMFRKDKKAREEWSSEAVELCAQRSRRIVANAFEALKEGGVLVYSTCTFNRSEDEDIIRWITENYEVENFEIQKSDSWTMLQTVECGVDCYKFMPHLTRGEGLFMAAVRKLSPTKEINFSGSKKKTKTKGKAKNEGFDAISKEEMAIASKYILNSENFNFLKFNEKVHIVDSDWVNMLSYIKERLYLLYYGVEIGEFFGKTLKPAHPLALSVHLNRESVPMVEVEKEVALEFLRKKSIDAEPFSEGINLVCFEGQPIGYVKRIGARVNNLFPKEYRILNL